MAKSIFLAVWMEVEMSIQIPVSRNGAVKRPYLDFEK
jgi:hypothetical protein